MRALVCAGCLPGVEKMGRVWAEDAVVEEAEEVKNVKEAKEREGARRFEEEMDGFCEENMENGSSELARE